MKTASPRERAASRPAQRDTFAQMLATLDAQLDHELAGLAGTPPAAARPPSPAAAKAAAPPARPAPAPPAAARAPRSMFVPAAVLVTSIAVVATAVMLTGLHWRPTRSLGTGAAPPVNAMLPAMTPAPTPAPTAAPMPPPVPAALPAATAPPAAALSIPAAGAVAAAPPARPEPDTPAAVAGPCSQARAALGLCRQPAKPNLSPQPQESSP